MVHMYDVPTCPNLMLGQLNPINLKEKGKLSSDKKHEKVSLYVTLLINRGRNKVLYSHH